MRHAYKILVISSLFATGTILAQGSNPLVLTLDQALIRSVTKDGVTTEQVTPNPKTVKPGDVLRQVITVRNTGVRSLSNVVVRLPVPKGTVYLKPEVGSKTTGIDVKPEYSINEGATYGPAPLKKTIQVLENGRRIEREVEVKPEEYTNVRWTIAHVEIGKPLNVGFRVQVK